MSDQVHRRGSERQPVGLQVRLAYDDLGEFVERYAINISSGGIFIRSREPRPVGSKLKFELHLRSGEVVFAGEGTVRWRQLPDARGLGLSGMGLQFDNLTDESRRVLEDIIAARDKEKLPPPVEGASPDKWAPIEALPPPVLTPQEIPKKPAPPVMAPMPAPSSRPPIEVTEPSTSGVALARVRTITKDVVLGIDFGWGSVRAAAGVGDKASLIPLSSAGGLPAVAASDGTQVVVGETARQALLQGKPGVRGIAQLLGRRPGAPGAASWRRRQLAEPVLTPEGTFAVDIGGQIVPVDAIAQLLLRDTRIAAEAHLRSPVKRAAFAVPASWTDAQRHALRAAAEAVGLEVTQFVSAPLAAMLACHGPRGKRRALVIHLGEGACEAAIVEQAGHVFDLMNVVADPNLGGADMDVQLVGSILTQFEQETGFLVPENQALFERTRDAAARTKEALSEELESEVVLDSLVEAGLSKADLRQRVSRARLVSVVGPLLDRVAELALSTMRNRNLQPGDLDEVLLFGAQARLTPFARRIAERIGREPARPDSAADAAAIGAALVGEGAHTVGRYVLAGAVGATVGIGIPGGGLKRMIDCNLPLPVERGYTIATSMSGQRDVELHIFQGERPEAFENDFVGVAVIGPLPPAPKGDTRIGVTLALDASGELAVRARDVSTGKTLSVTLDRKRSLDAARRALLPTA